MDKTAEAIAAAMAERITPPQAGQPRGARPPRPGAGWRSGPGTPAAIPDAGGAHESVREMDFSVTEAPLAVAPATESPLDRSGFLDLGAAAPPLGAAELKPTMDPPVSTLPVVARLGPWRVTFDAHSLHLEVNEGEGGPYDTGGRAQLYELVHGDTTAYVSIGLSGPMPDERSRSADGGPGSAEADAAAQQETGNGQ